MNGLRDKNYLDTIYITHVCGHKSLETIKCKMSELEQKKSEYEKALCFHCQNDFDNNTAFEKARKLNLPTLVGTEKQIKWASNIKFKILKSIKSQFYTKLFRNLSINLSNVKHNIILKDNDIFFTYFNNFEKIIDTAILCINNSNLDLFYKEDSISKLNKANDYLKELKLNYDKILNETSATFIIEKKDRYIFKNMSPDY